MIKVYTLVLVFHVLGHGGTAKEEYILDSREECVQAAEAITHDYEANPQIHAKKQFREARCEFKYILKEGAKHAG